MPAMHSENPRVGLFMTWLGKGLSALCFSWSQRRRSRRLLQVLA